MSGMFCRLVCLLLQKEVYLQVVVDVINGVREAFLDEGMDEQVLLELKQVKFYGFFVFMFVQLMTYLN